MESVQLVFDYFCERTPRSFVEARDTSVVWNYKYAGEYTVAPSGSVTAAIYWCCLWFLIAVILLELKLLLLVAAVLPASRGLV